MKISPGYLVGVIIQKDGQPAEARLIVPAASFSEAEQMARDLFHAEPSLQIGSMAALSVQVLVPGSDQPEQPAQE